MSRILELGWCQGYLGLEYHMEEAYKEANLDISGTISSCPPVAIFSRTYYTSIDRLDHTKKHDYCFIGAIHRMNWSARKWIIAFASIYFTENSIFINTTPEDDWELLGDYDYTGRHKWFSPEYTRTEACIHIQEKYRAVEENRFYFESMCQSRFILCPAGDAPWSFRFYETLMCKAIPIVESWHHTYRTEAESTIPYSYVLRDEYRPGNVPEEDYISNNTILFEKYHLLHPV